MLSMIALLHDLLMCFLYGQRPEVKEQPWDD